MIKFTKIKYVLLLSFLILIGCNSQNEPELNNMMSIEGKDILPIDDIIVNMYMPFSYYDNDDYSAIREGYMFNIVVISGATEKQISAKENITNPIHIFQFLCYSKEREKVTSGEYIHNESIMPYIFNQSYYSYAPNGINYESDSETFDIEIANGSFLIEALGNDFYSFKFKGKLSNNKTATFNFHGKVTFFDFFQELSLSIK